MATRPPSPLELELEEAGAEDDDELEDELDEELEASLDDGISTGGRDLGAAS